MSPAKERYMRRELTMLREKMRENGIGIYIIPTNDDHGSEYINDYFKCREYISGFTGSAGTLIVTEEEAGLWTDGRYFLQAEAELEGSGIRLMRMGEDGIPSVEDYMDMQAEKAVAGFDGRMMSCRLGTKIEHTFRKICDIDLVGEIWENRPSIMPDPIYSLDMSVTGESAESKLTRLRKEMRIIGADFVLLSKLEEIAWLYNLRGSDIANTPVFYAFAHISESEDTLYVMDERYSSAGQNIKAYADIFSDIAQLADVSLIVDDESISYTLERRISSSVRKIIGRTPVELMKAVKNNVEIRSTYEAHIRDGAAMAEFICWIKENASSEAINELSAAEYLEQCRRKRGAYDISFTTIAGYEEHGAIIHYSADEHSCSEIVGKGFLLVDSGGQYRDGTTDITRTIALGDVDYERRRNYTAVLKGHIALAMVRFDADTDGAQLDKIARRPLLAEGLDFAHGTGHGVGHMLSVHEGPNTISKRAGSSYIVPGMITTDEPGVYIEGQYGIRIENELLCIEHENGYAFENITFCPFERDAIEINMLTSDEIAYIDCYHRLVSEKLIPLLDEHTAKWLEYVCRPLEV